MPSGAWKIASSQLSCKSTSGGVSQRYAPSRKSPNFERASPRARIAPASPRSATMSSSAP